MIVANVRYEISIMQNYAFYCKQQRLNHFIFKIWHITIGEKMKRWLRPLKVKK